jgi:hypothetical protein
MIGCGLLLLGFAAGCVFEKQKARPKPPASSDSGDPTVKEINLLAIPVALNMDDKPGPDGFVIKLYATSPKRPKPFPIEAGRIEVCMYDGVPGWTNAASDTPRRTWVFQPEELRRYQVQTSIGTGYELALLWEDAKPTRDRISVIVRYTPPSGPALLSAPSVIAVR